MEAKVTGITDNSAQNQLGPHKTRPLPTRPKFIRQLGPKFIRQLVPYIFWSTYELHAHVWCNKNVCALAYMFKQRRIQFGFRGLEPPPYTPFLDILWKWNNLVSMGPNYFIFMGILDIMTCACMPRHSPDVSDSISVHDYAVSINLYVF